MNFSWKKFFIINVCLFIFVLVVCEATAFISYKKKFTPLIELHAKVQNNPKEFAKSNRVRYRCPQNFDYKKNIEDIVLHNKFISENSPKRPMVTIGCSYTYGAFLDRNQTFAYKLHQQTGRTIYNRGVCSTGPQHVYRQLADKNFKKDVPDAEYVIYTFIHHHIFRQVRDLVEEYGSNIELNYTIKNGNLSYRIRPFGFMYWSFLVKNYLAYIADIRYKNELKDGNPLLLMTMEKSLEKMRELYPDSKFVFLEYSEPVAIEDKTKKLSDEFIKNLEDKGIIYVNVSELVGQDFNESKYWADDEYHPSGLAWDEIVPKLVKKLDL